MNCNINCEIKGNSTDFPCLYKKKKHSNMKKYLLIKYSKSNKRQFS